VTRSIGKYRQWWRRPLNHTLPDWSCLFQNTYAMCLLETGTSRRYFYLCVIGL